jgi:hypothetical protein
MEQIMTSFRAEKSSTARPQFPGREEQADLMERGDWELGDPLGRGPAGVAA